MATVDKISTGWRYPIRKKGLPPITGTGYRTRSEAIAAGVEKENELRRLSGAADPDVKLVDYFDEWVVRYKEGKVSAPTMEWYHTTSKWLHVYFKDSKLREVTRQHYQDFVTWLGTDTGIKTYFWDGKKRKKKPLAETTVKKMNTYMKAMLEDAVYDGLVDRKFTHRIQITGAAGKPEAEKFLTYEELQKLTSYALEQASLKGMSYYMIYVQAYTGLRFEELLGLSWDRIDFEHKTLRVDRTWDYKSRPRKMHHGFAPTKNAPSHRTLRLTDKLLHVLKRLRALQSAQYLKRGYRDPDQLVFRDAFGQWVGNKGMNDTLHRACEACGVRPVTTHALRHTHGSVLLYSGINVMTVSRILGHGSLQVTLNTYLHVLQDLEARQQDEVIKVLENM